MPNDDPIRFLTLDDLLAIHADQLERYGGRPGLRDAGLLEAAAAMPAAGFDGVPMHGTLFEKAAAYVFHITRNHPFIDGNKRTGIVAGLVFLELHGLVVEAPTEDLVRLVESVARGELAKSDIARWLQAHATT